MVFIWIIFVNKFHCDNCWSWVTESWLNFKNQSDKGKKPTKEDKDIALPPPLQSLEKRLAVSIPPKQVCDLTLASPSDVDSVKHTQLAEGASALDTHNISFDEDELDLELAETEKSIRETQTKLGELEKATRMQSKRKKLSKMKFQLEKNQQRIHAASEKGESKQSKPTNKSKSRWPTQRLKLKSCISQRQYQIKEKSKSQNPIVRIAFW